MWSSNCWIENVVVFYVSLRSKFFCDQVGTNLVNISVGKKADVTLRELGGSMAPIWPTYYKDSPAVMVINAPTCANQCLQMYFAV